MHPPRTIGFTVKAVSNQIKRTIDNLDKENPPKYGKPMTGMQFGVVDFISNRTRNGYDVFQKDVEQEFNIRRSTASGILALMEKNGLLRRESVASDARLKKLVLTETAFDCQKELHNRVHEMERRIRQDLSPEEVETFFRIMDKISKSLD